MVNPPAPTNNQNSLDEILDRLMFEARHWNQEGNEGWQRSKADATTAINKTIMEEVLASLPEKDSYDDGEPDLDTAFIDGYNKAIDAIRQQITKKYGRADNE